MSVSCAAIVRSIAALGAAETLARDAQLAITRAQAARTRRPRAHWRPARACCGTRARACDKRKKAAAQKSLSPISGGGGGRRTRPIAVAAKTGCGRDGQLNKLCRRRRIESLSRARATLSAGRVAPTGRGEQLSRDSSGRSAPPLEPRRTRPLEAPVGRRLASGASPVAGGAAPPPNLIYRARRSCN